MANFQAALRTVSDALTARQIGEPVALRIVAHGSPDHGHVERAAAEAMSGAAAWFGCEPDRLAVAGSVASGQLTALARFAGGQSALVSAGSCGVGRPLLVIEVWGSRGMLSWVDEQFTGVPLAEDALSAKARILLQRIQQSLQSDTPGRKTGSEQRRAPLQIRAQRPPYGVLLISGDHTHQPNYAEPFAADARCRIVGLTDEADVSERRRALNEQLAKRLGIPVIADLRDALARDDVQIVSICAEPERRGRSAVLAAQGGKHLYLDKPLAGSLSDADAIVAAVAKSGVVAHMFSLVHNDPARRVRALVDSGELGELTAVHLDLTFAKGQSGAASLGTSRAESSVPDRFELPDSKRELTNVGVYAVVQLLTLIDRPVRRVTAATGNYFFSEHQQNNMEDFGQMLLEFEGGIVASVSAGRTGWHSHPAGGLNRAFLIGARGCALVDAHEPHVEVWSDAEPWKPPGRNPDDPMAMWATPPGSPFTIAPRRAWLTPAPADVSSDVRHFLDCIEQGRDSLVSAPRAALATEILMAAYQSAASGGVGRTAAATVIGFKNVESRTRNNEGGSCD